MIYSASVLNSDKLTCWSDLVYGLGGMTFYFTILLQSLVLWFNDRVTQERFRQVQTEKVKGVKLSWFIRNKNLVRDENIYMFMFAFVGLPWIVASFMYILGYVEPEGVNTNTYDRTTYLNRCARNYAIASQIVGAVCGITMALQVIMLVLSRNISESMMLKREVQIASVASIVMGFSSLIWNGIQSHIGMQVSFSLFLIAFTVSSIVIPLKAAIDFKRARKTLMDPPTVILENEPLKANAAPATPKSHSASNSHYKNYITMIKEKLNNDEELYNGFKRFLMSEFALENIMFLETSTMFMMNPSPPALNELYLQFIAARADHEINVAHSLRTAVQNKLESFAEMPNKNIQSEEKLFEKDLMDRIYKMEQETYDMLTGGPLIRYKLQLINSGVNLTPTRTSSTSIPLKSPSHSSGTTTGQAA
jgi:hypothetical protein